MNIINNKYTKWYNNLISYRQDNPPSCEYTERHHIVPKSLGGSNENKNIVVLTAREHFIAHLLLTKMFTDTYSKEKMCYAFHMMFGSDNENRPRYMPSSVWYEYRMKNLAVFMSRRMKGKVPWNKGIKRSEEERAKMSATKKANNECKRQQGVIVTWNKGIKRSEEERAKMSTARQAGNKKKREQGLKVAWNDGIERSEEDRRKMKQGWKQKIENGYVSPLKGKTQPTIECPHCGKIGSVSNMKRWHFDNCRELNETK